MDYIEKIKLLNLTKTAKQTIALYLAQIGTMFFGFLFTVLNARLLSKFEFGSLNFYVQVLMTIALFFEFGYFTAGSRLIALEKNYAKEREFVGALYFLGLVISIGYVFTLLVLSFFVDDIFKSSVKNLILIGLIPSIAFPFQFLIQLVFQGSNEILKLSVYTLFPRMLYFFFIGFAFLLNFFSLSVSSLSYVLSFFVATLFTILISKPKFTALKENLKKIFYETKTYGIKVYFGRIAGMLGYQSNVLLIQYFAAEIQVANYSLVNFFTTPISVFSRSLCTSLFKGFAYQEKIPKRVFKINFLWLFLSSALYLIIGGFILELLFSKKYAEAIPLILPLIGANFFIGAFQPYNFYLSAKGEGNYLRNTAIVYSLLAIILNLIFIPIYGAMGAAYATFASIIINFLLHRHYYKKILERK